MGKRQYSQQQRDERAAQDAALSQRATDALGDTTAMTDYAARLVTMAPSVQRLSLRNQTLLCTQADDRGMNLRDVASFRGWLERGRCVRKGEKGLRMVAPKGTETTETKSDQDEHDQDATEASEDEQPARPRFRMVTVFDVSQTEGVEDFEQDDIEPSEPDVSMMLDRLTSQVDHAGYLVDLVHDFDQATIDHETCTVPMPMNRPETEQYVALMPAVAEALTHSGSARQKRETSTRAESEPTAATGDSGADVVRMDLGEHYGTAEVTVATDWQRGWTAYTVSAPNVSGTFVVLPCVNVCDYEQVPTEVTMHFGTPRSRHDHAGYRPRPDAPVVNGIALLSEFVSSTVQVERGRLGLRALRSTSSMTSEPVPDKTQARVRAVALALLRHWFARPDLQAVRLAFAQHEAPGRASAERADADRVQDRITELIRERDRHLAIAEDQERLTATAEPEPDESPEGDTDTKAEPVQEREDLDAEAAEPASERETVATVTTLTVPKVAEPDRDSERVPEVIAPATATGNFALFAV